MNQILNISKKMEIFSESQLEEMRDKSLYYDVFSDSITDYRFVRIPKHLSDLIGIKTLEVNEHRKVFGLGMSNGWKYYQRIEDLLFFKRPTSEKKKIEKFPKRIIYEEPDFNIYEKLIERENKYKIDPDYLSNQIDVKVGHRNTVVKYMYQVVDKSELSLDIYFLSVYMFDMFLSYHRERKDNLRLLSIVCISIAVKILATDLVFISDLIKVSGIENTQREFFEKELEVCEELNFSFLTSNTYLFIKELVKKYNLKDESVKSLTFLALLTSTSYKILKYKPSLIAEACLYLIFDFKYTNEIVPVISRFITVIYAKESRDVYSAKYFVDLKFEDIDSEQVDIEQFSKISLKNEIVDYELKNLIGEGTYGQVFRGKKGDNENVAIKIFKSNISEEGIPLETIREVSLLKDFNHPNILRALDIIVDTDNIMIVLELLDQDLLSLMRKRKLTFDEVTYYFNKICLGIEYLHSNNVIHRDIKPQNILVTKNVIKIGDFGASRNIYEKEGQWTGGLVTLWYRPPELLLFSDEYTNSVDIWSLGCTLVEMINNKPLFPGEDIYHTLFLIFSKFGTGNLNRKKYKNVAMILDTYFYPQPLETFIGTNDRDLLDLLYKIFSIDYVTRIKINNILNSDFLKKNREKNDKLL
jgi:hypothetical protein